jgi:hypothetical protein
MAIAAAPVGRKPPVTEKISASVEGAGSVHGSNSAVPPDAAEGPASFKGSTAKGPTAAKALAGVRAVALAPVVDLVTGAGPAKAKENPGMKAMPAHQTQFDTAMFARWRKAMAAKGETIVSARGALLLTLLDALGVKVPQGAWLETVGPVGELAAVPPPGLLAALDRGAKEGRVGETVLLALTVLGADSPGKLHPSAVGPVVRALVAIGLAQEARALALEVAFGAEF